MRFGYTPLSDPMTVDPSRVVDLNGPAKLPVMNANMMRAPGAPQKEYKPALWEVLDGMFGLGIADAIDAANARHARPEQMAKLQQTLSLLPPDAQRDAILAIKPDAWASSAAKQYEPQVVAPGSMQVTNGRQTVYNPKVEMAGDSAVSLSPTGMEVLGQRPPSYAEQATAGQKSAEQLIQEALLPAKLRLLSAQAAKAARPPAGRGGGGVGAGKPKPWERKF